MSAFDMKPTFKDQAGFKAWMANWTEMFRLVSREIRSTKDLIKELQAAGSESAKKYQKNLENKRIMARKLMTLRQEAFIHWQNIKDMKKSLEEMFAGYPLTIEDARNIDFHFNKKHLEYSFIPMWILKAKGKTYYINHLDCEAPFTTKETPEHPSTKGAIRIRRGNIHIDKEGNATITAV